MCQLQGWDLSRETLAKIEGQSRWISDFELVFLATTLGLTLQELLPAPASKNQAKKLVTKLERRLE
jgi:hypothetical protein